jgi:hypothetical protein
MGRARLAATRQLGVIDRPGLAPKDSDHENVIWVLSPNRDLSLSDCDLAVQKAHEPDFSGLLPGDPYRTRHATWATPRGRNVGHQFLRDFMACTRFRGHLEPEVVYGMH